MSGIFINILKVVLIVLFILCWLDMPWTYFQLVRSIGMIGFAILSYDENIKGNKHMAILWGLSAIIINPVVKVSLGRSLWNIIDLIWATLLCISLKNNWKQNSN